MDYTNLLIMSKKMNLSATTTTMGTFTTSGTWAFMQDAWNEGIVATIIAMIGSSYSPATVYILYGCTLSTGGGNTTIAPGAVFFNGEVYLAPGNIFTTPTGSNIVVTNLSVANTYVEPDGVTNIDPASYEDGTPRNTYNMRTATFAGGLTGTGTLSTTSASDYGNLVLATPPFLSAGIVFNPTGSGALFVSNVGSPYYNFGYKIIGNEVHLCGAISVSNGVGVGAIELIGLPANIWPASSVILNATNNCTSSTILTLTSGGIIELTATGSGGGNIYFDSVICRIK